MSFDPAEIDELYADCDFGVNDEVTYQRVGLRPRTLDARVNYSDKTDQFGGSQITSQDIEIEVRKALVVSVHKNDRIYLPRDGRWFNPKEWKSSVSGVTWIIYVKVER